jgi:hypothetical protein
VNHPSNGQFVVLGNHGAKPLYSVDCAASRGPAAVLHTREVAGSKPAAPMSSKPSYGYGRLGNRPWIWMT